MRSQHKPELDWSVQLQHCEVMTLGDVIERLHPVPAWVEDDPLDGDTHGLSPGLCPVTDPQVDLELLGRGAETLSRTSRPRAVIRGHGEPGLPAGPSSAPIGVLVSNFSQSEASFVPVGPDTVGRSHHVAHGDEAAATEDGDGARALPPPPRVSPRDENIPRSLLRTT